MGWGGLPQTFDERDGSWARERAELKGLLTDEEWIAARASTLDAFYTQPTVARAMWETLERMGLQDARILEPSCGVGNFFGAMPPSMSGSRLQGVELDSISGRIARQLYQDARITIDGFERTRFADGSFDAAIGNVPFGSWHIVDADRRYDGLMIHDHFIAKALDKVRPGGVVALITSKGTMDKLDSTARRYIADRSFLLGAVRLPNDAFKANAGTSVTTDILFLQKRRSLRSEVERDPVIPGVDLEAEEHRSLYGDPSWIAVMGNDEPDAIPVNEYFHRHPEMILGRMVMTMGAHGPEATCEPIEGADLSDLLRTALGRIEGKIPERPQALELGDSEAARIAAEDSGLRPYSYGIVGGKLMYREGDELVEPDLSVSAKARARGMVELRDATRAVIDAQMRGCSDDELAALQTALGDVYERFAAAYGRVNDPANAKAFDEDSSYYLLCGLERFDDQKRYVGRSDMFEKRTIRAATVPTSVETAQEALLLSMTQRGRVDMGHMRGLTGKDEDRIVEELEGAIFRVPGTGVQTERVEGDERRVEQIPAQWQTADEYLSGDIRKKLEVARRHARTDPHLQANVEALEAAMPRELTAAEIDVRLGATWIDRMYVKQFLIEMLAPPHWVTDRIRVEYSPHTSAWHIEGKNADIGNVRATSTYGTKAMNAWQIAEETLNLKTVRVMHTEIGPDGRDRRVVDEEATALAQQKQEEMKELFKKWAFADPERRDRLVATYNEKFNSVRPRGYDGSALAFPGMSQEITLRPHQRDAIARVLFGGNTLLAHEVGAGKTYEMAAAAMESKRLGLASKSLFVVPNHLTEQMAIETLRLYPGANVLVATQKDLEAKNRKKFCARIATGDWDAVIIGHSQFEKIPLSQERQERALRRQIEEITRGIHAARGIRGGGGWSVKQMEKARKGLETKLEKLQARERKDDVITFEELGVDRLFVDEAHSFKNLYLYTKMHNVAGIPQAEAQKSQDMFMKCRYMDEQTGRKGVVFATGTPVSNSMTELYTMQRYLQFDQLEEMGLGQFDAWASTFGETVSALELAPEGTGFRMKTRFARFFNLPELMAVFKEVADIKTADELGLDRPEARYHTVSVEPTEEQKGLVAALSERASKVHHRRVRPEDDNMLKITSDGRKIGLDQRLIDPLLPDAPGSKVNACMENVLKIWEEGKEERTTQLVFCDFSTPGKDKGFNVYDDMKKKLVARGVPKEEIAFIHDARTEKDKEALFERVRNGEVRVLMGSTQKMGSGTNVQDRLIATHDLDCPWRPADLEQRAGRIVRQGNRNPEVHIYRYVTEGTFDAYLWQTVENKQKFISQIMTSKAPLRSCEDVDESVLSYAEVKALCIGDPRIKEKMELDIDVSKLRLQEKGFQQQKFELEDKLRKAYPERERKLGLLIEHLKADAHRSTETKDAPFTMTILGKRYATGEDGEPQKKEAAEALVAAAQALGGAEGTIGEYRGFEMSFYHDLTFGKTFLTLTGATTHRVELGESAMGNLTRIENVLDKIDERLAETIERLEEHRAQVATAQEDVRREFPKAEELAVKAARLAELNAALALDGRKQPQDEQPAMPEQQPKSEAQLREEQEESHVVGYNELMEEARATGMYDLVTKKKPDEPEEQEERTQALPERIDIRGSLADLLDKAAAHIQQIVLPSMKERGEDLQTRNAIFDGSMSIRRAARHSPEAISREDALDAFYAATYSLGHRADDDATGHELFQQLVAMERSLRDSPSLSETQRAQEPPSDDVTLADVLPPREEAPIIDDDVTLAEVLGRESSKAGKPDEPDEQNDRTQTLPERIDIRGDLADLLDKAADHIQNVLLPQLKKDGADAQLRDLVFDHSMHIRSMARTRPEDVSREGVIKVFAKASLALMMCADHPDRDPTGCELYRQVDKAAYAIRRGEARPAARRAQEPPAQQEDRTRFADIKESSWGKDHLIMSVIGKDEPAPARADPAPAQGGVSGPGEPGSEERARWLDANVILDYHRGGPTRNAYLFASEDKLPDYMERTREALRSELRGKLIGMFPNLASKSSDMSVYVSPRTDGQKYEGEVVHMDDERGFIVQRTGKKSFYVHRCDALDRVPKIDERVAIRYPQEQGQKAGVYLCPTKKRRASAL
ncbi:MAG: DEAD/DEAH box helicase family protein [Synergistaceae bacterium]|nr:DEAD/DEAH box helicase family protein [Synergistaceae bacterium]